MRRLAIVYPDAVTVDIRQGGLFEDFTPVREQWARMSGGRWTDSVRAFFEAVAGQHRMPMDTNRMIASVDDFTSTWPACIAAKAADIQGLDVGRRYLRALREAWCLEGEPIHRTDVQVEVARACGLDVTAFAKALEDGSAGASFQADREECERVGVTGFPTFVAGRGSDSVRINGWQPWEVFEDTLRQVDPELTATILDPTEASVAQVLRRFARCATREVASILGTTDDEAEILLEELEGRGKALRRAVGGGLMWETAEQP